MKITTFILLSALFCFGAMAQEPAKSSDKSWIHLIHAEAGYTTPDGTITEGLAVRQNISSYYTEQSSQGQLYSSTHGIHAGFRYEIYSPDKKLGVSSGLRFSSYTTSITGYSSQHADFFYLRYSSEGLDTKFARVKSISEENKHLCMPIEIRYIPFGFRNVHYYLKAGIEPAYRFQNSIGIEFQDPAMDAYREGVVAGFSNAVSTFTSTVYPAIGIQIGNQKFQGMNIEFLLPSFYLTRENFNLSEMKRYTGFRISYQFPLGK